MKRLTTFIAGAAVAATLGGCQQPAVSGWKSFSGDKNIERRVDSVLQLMTLEEKVGQMAQYSCNWDVTGPVMTGDYETLLKQGLVGSLFNVYTVDGVRKMQEMALSESRLKIPVLFGMMSCTAIVRFSRCRWRNPALGIWSGCVKARRSRRMRRALPVSLGRSPRWWISPGMPVGDV